MPYYPPSNSGGATTTASNVGTGEGLVFQTVSGSNLVFRSILAGTNIQVTTTTDVITISGPAGSGEANTASNVGTGAGQVYKSKTGVNLDLRNIAAGSNLNVTTGTNDITIGLTNTPTVDAFAMADLGATPSTPATGYQWLFVTAGGAGLLNSSAQSIQIFDGWRGVLTTSTVSSSVTYASTGLVSATLPIGYYQFQVAGAFQSNTTASGFGGRINVGNATVSEVFARWGIRQAADGTDTFYEYSQLATTTNVTSLSVVAANTKYPFVGHGWFRITAQGTMRLEFRSEVASPSQVTLSTGTSMIITRVG
jgi:hypothetical protein